MVLYKLLKVCRFNCIKSLWIFVYMFYKVNILSFLVQLFSKVIKNLDVLLIVLVILRCVSNREYCLSIEQLLRRKVNNFRFK